MRRLVILAACLCLSSSSFAKWPPSTHTGWTHGGKGGKGGRGGYGYQSTGSGNTSGFYLFKR